MDTFSSKKKPLKMSSQLLLWTRWFQLALAAGAAMFAVAALPHLPLRCGCAALLPPPARLFDLYFAYRLVQLVETPLLVAARGHVSRLHLLHHVAMGFTAALWRWQPTPLGLWYLWVNSIDNTLHYLNMYFAGRFRFLRVAVRQWTATETAVIVVLTSDMLFSSCWRGDFSRHVALVLGATSILHAAIGFWLSQRRSGL
jgi:hypothetical protein